MSLTANKNPFSLSGGGSGGTVRWFPTTSDRDAYYATNSDELKQNPTVGVGDPAVAWQWNGTAWVQSAIALQGPKGDKGDPGVNGVASVNGFANVVTIGTAAAANIKVQDFFSASDFAVGTDGKIKSIGGGGSGGGIPEAPVDGKIYGRKDAGWTEVTGSGGGGDAPADAGWIMRPETFSFTTGDSQTFTLAYVPKFATEVLILKEQTFHYLQAGDYTLSSNTITINSPTLEDGDSIKIVYATETSGISSITIEQVNAAIAAALATKDFIQPPEVLAYDGSVFSSLSQTPKYVIQAELYQGTTFELLQESDFTYTGTNFNIVNPAIVLSNSDKAKIIYAV